MMSSSSSSLTVIFCVLLMHHATMMGPKMMTLAQLQDTTTTAANRHVVHRDLAPVAKIPACFWNHAYTENYDADTYDEIIDPVAGALDQCYVLVDPFLEDLASSTANKIATMKAVGSANNAIGCYTSVGTCEDWRDDFDEMRPYCVTKEWGDWEGEYFVYDVSSIAPLMKRRIDRMAAWGCDYVEFDNMDWWYVWIVVDTAVLDVLWWWRCCCCSYCLLLRIALSAP